MEKEERQVSKEHQISEEQQVSEGTIEGRNSVTEAINAGRPLDKVFIAKGSDKTLQRIAAKARAAGAVVVETDRRALDSMSVTDSHQGVIAYAAVSEYRTVADILEIARSRDESPLIVVCDGISDTQNLGAIIRTAECAGAHGIIIPKRRSAGLSAGVGKASAGAAWHMAVARVPNLVSALDGLKESGLWVFGSDPGDDGGDLSLDNRSNPDDGNGGRSSPSTRATRGGTQLELWSADFTGGVCLVVGSESDGMARLTRDKCDFLVRIPMNGKMTSLNASASAAILLYEVLRQRQKDKSNSEG